MHPNDFILVQWIYNGGKRQKRIHKDEFEKFKASMLRFGVIVTKIKG